ncbi:MAG TPA: four helix bundle protein [Pyrinomonadaceae bacterium]|nr:four helix bundle protein [Pyrinomonadaceae bacterium]HQY66229.1 four helix bundle protein [Pyrinomonadaceae bacterium]HRA39536.1 four helix bundle protein [Pyrinomonadaceae bacterium]
MNSESIDLDDERRFTSDDSRTTIHERRSTNDDPRTTIHERRFTTDDSRPTIHERRFTIHDRRFTLIMRSHEKLDVWKRSIDLVVFVYRLTENFPSEEKFGLTSQIRRAAVSIPANIAEGAARETDKDFGRFLTIAQGSASEVETELLIANRLGFLSTKDFDEAMASLDGIGRMITGLSKHLKRKSTT